MEEILCSMSELWLLLASQTILSLWDMRKTLNSRFLTRLELIVSLAVIFLRFRNASAAEAFRSDEVGKTWSKEQFGVRQWTKERVASLWIYSETVQSPESTMSGTM